jgi:hypothetical protein
VPAMYRHSIQSISEEENNFKFYELFIFRIVLGRRKVTVNAWPENYNIDECKR